MPLMPSETKHRKEQRGRLKGNATRGNYVAFGDYGLQALEPGWITARQIEAGRVAIAHAIYGEGKLWTRIFPDKPVTSTAAETRMGKGKGEPEQWVAPIKPGTILYEVGGMDEEETARTAMNRVAHKLPIRVRMVRRRNL